MKSVFKNMLRLGLVLVLIMPAAYGACCTTDTCSSTCDSSTCSTCSDGCGCTSCSDCESCCTDCNFCDYGKTWFSQRDQGANEYLVMQLTAEKRHQFDREEFYGDFDITLGWQQNFSRSRISSYFLNKNGKMTVGANGSSVTGTKYSDVRASDLGLSTTFTGEAWLCPKYQDFIADFDLYLAWDEFVQGLWTELRIPFVHTIWNSGLGTSVDQAGGTHYADFEDTTATTTDYFVTGATSDAVPVVYTGSCALSSALLGNSTFGQAPKLEAGKIINHDNKANGLGGIHFTLGYDFLRRERGNLGLALHVEFPAANKPCKNNCGCDLFIFEPKIGSQHAWKVGGVLRGQYMLWDRDQDERIDMYADLRVDGVFSGETTRLLGLNANGTSLFNQYLLLKKYTISGATASYQGLERAANLLKACVKADPSAEGQATIMFQYMKGGFVGALGYNFFGRGEEKVCVSKLCSCPDYSYVIKGDLPVLKTDGTDAGFYSHSDSNINQTGVVSDAAGEDSTAVTATYVTDAAINFSTCGANINVCTAAHPNYYSNTIFGHLGYHWNDVDWQPFLGLLGKVDIGTKNTALRLWGVYLKGGICF